jgi:hypothetical protein
MPLAITQETKAKQLKEIEKKDKERQAVYQNWMENTESPQMETITPKTTKTSSIESLYKAWEKKTTQPSLKQNASKQTTKITKTQPEKTSHKGSFKELKTLEEGEAGPQFSSAAEQEYKQAKASLRQLDLIKKAADSSIEDEQADESKYEMLSTRRLPATGLPLGTGIMIEKKTDVPAMNKRLELNTEQNIKINEKIKNAIADQEITLQKVRNTKEKEWLKEREKQAKQAKKEAEKAKKEQKEASEKAKKEEKEAAEKAKKEEKEMRNQAKKEKKNK